MEKVNVNQVKMSKGPALPAGRQGQKIVMLTAYDYPFAKILDEAGVDIVLIGDSLGNVALGYRNTLPVTMEEMIIHTRAVSRAVTASRKPMLHPPSVRPVTFPAPRIVVDVGTSW